ncbi:MAG: antibiotic biosynthesis monooxygenase family protein [Rhodothermales bacterium]
MLIRLVRMTFRPDSVGAFLAIFDESASQIRSFPGCLHLELWQDLDGPNVFTTYSLWEDEAALERYRRSEFFTRTWARTRALFSAPPVAQSHRQIRSHSSPNPA